MDKVTPFIRILLYIAAGRLSAIGLPREATDIISSDPLFLEVVTWGVSGIIAIGAVVWWRIAKRLGWST